MRSQAIRSQHEWPTDFGTLRIPRLSVELFERDAFKALFSFGGTLTDLDRSQVSGIKDAAVNAKAFAAEVIERLRGKAEPVKAEVA